MSSACGLACARTQELSTLYARRQKVRRAGVVGGSIMTTGMNFLRSTADYSCSISFRIANDPPGTGSVARQLCGSTALYLLSFLQQFHQCADCGGSHVGDLGEQ
jgi:hypothetical protein